MLTAKEIQCPICDTKISKMGGGIAGHWGVDKCKTCNNWIDFDREMLAQDKDIPTERPLVPGEVHIPKGTNKQESVVGEIQVEGEKDYITLMTAGYMPSIFTQHASRQGVSMFQGYQAALKTVIDSEKRVNELITYFADRFRSQLLGYFLTDEVTARAINCELDLPELDDIVSIIAHRTVCLQKENEQKDKLIALYQKQEEARKQYQSDNKRRTK